MLYVNLLYVNLSASGSIYCLPVRVHLIAILSGDLNVFIYQCCVDIENMQYKKRFLAWSNKDVWKKGATTSQTEFCLCGVSVSSFESHMFRPLVLVTQAKGAHLVRQPTPCLHPPAAVFVHKCETGFCSIWHDGALRNHRANMLKTTKLFSNGSSLHKYLFNDLEFELKAVVFMHFYF